MKSLMLFSFVFSMAACSWEQSTKPSFLVVAVEYLNSDAVLCGDPEASGTEGLDEMCADSVRFTHAYTPSTMSQSSLASIMTGLYPQENGVWHNGQHFLSEKFHTVAEVALSKNYSTSFFSGGPPIWKKSGLFQGFELFEDNINVSRNEMYRPVAKNFELFLNWYDEYVDGHPFFSFIYVPDLQFPNSTTVNNFGQERATGFDSQLSEINESFAGLFQKMKSLRIWDNTYIVVVGLNGRTPETRTREINAVNLRSENTQVLLMIKPAKKTRDSGTSWSIDANVSLTDLGATLHDLLGNADDSFGYNKHVGITSLRGALVKPQVDWSRDRFILNTSAWAQWRGVGGIRTAVRKDNLLFINDVKPLLLNTLTDRFEMQPVKNDGAFKSSLAELKEFLSSQAIAPWENITETLVKKVHLAGHLVRSADVSAEYMKLHLSHLVQQRPWDKQVLGWLARLALYESDWSLLENLGVEHIYPIWVFVAQKNTGIEIAAPQDACWDWLNKNLKQSKTSTTCNDSEFIAFAEWTRESETTKKSILEDRFVRLHAIAETDEVVARTNFQNGLSWDTAVDIPAEPRNIQLAFALPEFKSMKLIIEKRLKRF